MTGANDSRDFQTFFRMGSDEEQMHFIEKLKIRSDFAALLL